MALNISVQRAVLFFDFKYSLLAAMSAGTLAGLILKYILDKKYIFYYRTKKISHDINKFVLYSFLGGLTTVVFWSVELFFEFCVKLPSSKYIGAVLGLTIGYTLKYFLDKRYVFICS
ncbi:GtrA family protein [candidate division WOR-3 bacterium]|nr:GtrA family protein [candidate division WOR-3 bacterium]